MVLEAVAAVGLVGNIFQFIDFACKLVSLSSDIRDSANGSAPIHADISIIANDIKSHTANLERSKWTGSRPDDLLNRTDAVARELLSTIYLISKRNSRGHRWRSFRQALESVWKQGRIKEFQERLEALRGELQYHIVVETRNDQSHIRETLEKLSQRAISEPDIRHKMTELAGVVKNIDRSLTRVETKLAVTPNESQLYEALITPRKKYLILKSLEFSYMAVRYSSITDAHEKTYEWIFAPESSANEHLHSSVSFPSWLEHGNGVYWITGKPGAGKSTLMKFIDDHSAKLDLLQRWAGQSRLVTASFYFWNPGTSMQKQLQGLLQTLLHRIISNCPQLIKVLCSERWISDDTVDVISTPWTMSELRNAFANLENESNLSTRFFFLIDGLDECEGDHYELVDLVERLSKQPHLKLCVSSRPWNTFQRTIGMSNDGHLEVHKLTRNDIELFARESIVSQARRLDPNISEQKYESLVQEIAERAQGVFLWVRLVVHSLRDGIANDDPPSLLMERLEDIPTALEEFFDLILRSVDRVYHKRMAQTFLAGLATESPMSLFSYSFLEGEDTFQDWVIKYETMKHSEVSDRLSQTRVRLNGRYLGLLEPAQLRSTSETRNPTVSFLHRTLRDYLRTPKMQKFLVSLAPAHFDPARAVAGVLFATIVSTFELPEPNHFVNVLEFGTSAAKRANDPSFEYEVVDKVEEIIQATAQKDVKPMHLMLKAATHIRQMGYVHHKVMMCGDKVDKDWVLAHTATDCCATQSFAEYFDNNVTIDQLQQCTCAILDSFRGRKHPEQENSFAEALYQKWFARNSSDFIDTTWLGHPSSFESYLGGFFNRTCWNLIRLLMRKGRKVSGEHWVWSHMIVHDPHLRDSDLSSLLEGFCFLLQHQVVLDAQTFVTFLFALHGRRLTPRIRVLVETLFTLFLTHGVDITRAITKPVPTFKLVEGTGIWYHFFTKQLDCSQRLFCGFEPHVLFKLFFQHGLDPNHTVGDKTIWEHLLVSFPSQHTASSLQVRAEMMILFLEFGADPNSAMLDSFTSTTCPVPELDSTGVEKVVRTQRLGMVSRPK